MEKRENIAREKWSQAMNRPGTAGKKYGRRTSKRIMMSRQCENFLKMPDEMLRVIAVALNTSMASYGLRSRKRDIVELRFIAAMFLRMYFPHITLQQIAVFFGGLDHSSVVSGLARAYSLLYTGDDGFTRKYSLASEAVQVWLETTNGIAA